METEITLNDRSQKLLELLVECYIRDGQPIGSKTLAEEVSSAMSPATIRNIMADLEDAGFIDSLHTSSGRVPTDRGYRFFVDRLLNAQLPSVFNQESIATQLSRCGDVKELVSSASSLLSSITKFTGLVMLPSRGNVVLKHVEFLSLSNNRVLAILVLNQQEVQNRIIYTDRCYTASELQQIGNFLTVHFSGKELSQIRNELLVVLDEERNNISQLTQSIIEMTDKVLGEDKEQGDYVVTGEANLFDFADYSGVGKLRELFTAFAQKRDILHLFNQCLHADKVKIYIGKESGYEPLDDCSVVAMPYHRADKVVGVLGIIGPTRMPYNQTIAAVDVTSKLLSAALGEVE
ncbi:MAG: heat-inducible transcriptional repressor HrcA [Gammaproteobacteria bacterium]|nr:heat-inducible transcriptional repressor HrcA [Gammaproteobacteria bacterium]